MRPRTGRCHKVVSREPRSQSLEEHIDSAIVSISRAELVNAQ